MRLGTYLVRYCFHKIVFDLLDVVRLFYKHLGLYKCHKIPLVYDHQELACTPKYPPRRVDMKEITFSFDKETY